MRGQIETAISESLTLFLAVTSRLVTYHQPTTFGTYPAAATERGAVILLNPNNLQTFMNCVGQETGGQNMTGPARLDKTLLTILNFLL
jgi:hypothetical protein